MTTHFLELSHSFQSAQVLILPIPYEQTTSYIKGTKFGPEAILKASSQLELYDSELHQDLSDLMVHTLPTIKSSDLNLIETTFSQYLASGKWIVSLGGEHTITVPLFKQTCAFYDEPVGLVHLDAHFDLRDSYEGSPYNHACVLRRCREYSKHTLSLGVRAFCSEEADYAKTHSVAHITDIQLRDQGFNIQEELSVLPGKVYLTIDLDFFSPAEFPGVGTPVPGGPDWWTGLSLIRTIFQTKEVVGMDIVELCPETQSIRSDFAAAQLVWKCMAYH